MLDLVDDGADLAARLVEVARMPPADRAQALDAHVRPVIEIATPGAKCAQTGVDLFEAWRYFRHTWSLEYRPTPGRSLAFLIRNAARPKAPVMAIGALASPTLQLRVRDEWIGWSTETFVRRFIDDPHAWREARGHLLRALDEGVASVRADDFALSGELTPGEATERRLRAIAEDARERRTEELKQRGERVRRGEALEPLRDLPLMDDGSIDWRAAGDRTLWVAKRAKTLADLLFARRVLEAAPPALDAKGELARSAQLRQALAIASREVRKVGLASRVLELNVCGAVPPYRDLLGGKLAALAVASVELISEYQRRYGRQASEIASQMAGREIVRTTDVCLITTTSLYAVSASQYNRLKVEVGVGTGARTLHWQDLGLTGGYGTIHLSDESTHALRDLSILRRGRRNVNNVFGEGQSPRMRQVREALDDLGIDANLLLQHSTPRRVYALKLTDDALARLQTNARGDARQPTFEDIAAAWSRRWLARRIEYAPALERVAAQGPRSVRAELRPREAAQPSLPGLDLRAAEVPPQRPPAPRGAAVKAQASNVELIRSLYRATGACSDHHDDKTIRALHIPTAVDDFLRERAKRGGVIFVTGNPGDGKTFLLRALAADLKASKVEVILDANEEDDDVLRQRIEGALRKSSGGVAIAINEGILVNLLHANTSTGRASAWVEEARDQLLRPFVYGADPPKAARANVCVVDLNLRNNLAPDVVRRALRTMLEQLAPCGGCPGATRCAAQLNAARIQLAEERVTRLLDAVASSGFHATMRDVQGFLSFALFGGATCASAKSAGSASPYWSNMFEGGAGALFDEVRRFDPKAQTAPLLDDELWRGADTASDWGDGLPEAPELPSAIQQVRLATFLWRKRRAMFEHKRGDAILRAAQGVIDKTFRDILEGGARALKTLVRLINRFFDRDDVTSESLRLWVTHRYDARPSRYAASLTSVSTTALEVVAPQLRPEVRAAFKDYRPSFVVLRAKGAAAGEGLRVDRALVAALTAGESGLPSTFRRGEPEARVASFFDRLARLHVAEEGDVSVRLVDMDTGANLDVAVDVAGRSYL